MKTETVHITVPVKITYSDDAARAEAIREACARMYANMWSSYRGGNFSIKAFGGGVLAAVEK